METDLHPLGANQFEIQATTTRAYQNYSGETYSMGYEITQETKCLSPEETAVLKIIEHVGGGKVSPSELSRISRFGMRDTQAIVAFLLRNELITKTEETIAFLQITEKGIDVMSHLGTVELPTC